MLKNYFTIALRNFSKYKLYSAINIFGLSIGMTFSLLILLFLQDEFSFDQFHENKNSIYRADILALRNDKVVKRYPRAPFPMTQVLKQEVTSVKYASQYASSQKFITFQDKSFLEEVFYVDPDFLQMFTLKFEEGEPSSVLNDPYKIAISQSISKKVFGDKNPIGEVLKLDDKQLVVSGVFEDLPPNSSLNCQIITHINHFQDLVGGSWEWGMKNIHTFVQLEADVKPEYISQTLESFARSHLTYDENENFRESIQLTPLTDIHFDHTMEWHKVSNIQYSYILGGLALLILGIACINYILLALANTASRSKEVGIRKVMGATSAQIRWQFWRESQALILLVLVIAIIFTQMALPAFNEFTSKNLTLLALKDWKLITALFFILLLTAILAGGYPAFVLSGILPQKILKGMSGRKHKTSFGNYLITFQFAICICLIIGVTGMYIQMEYIQNKDLGFNQDQVVMINTTNSQGIKSETVLKRYRNELADEANFLQISAMQGDFGTFRMGYVPDSVTINVTVVDYNFFETLEAELVEGRFFKNIAQDSFAYVVNEAMAKRVGSHALGAALDINPYGSIVGIVKNFHFQSLENEITPAIFMLGSNDFKTMLVKISTQDIPQSLEELERTWGKVTGDDVFNYSFLDDKLNRQYQSYQRWMKIVLYASLFGITIACLGLIGLTGLVTLNRTQEIGIRKVLGASVSNILFLLSKDYIKLIGIALLIAVPIANYFITEWLQNFAYRIGISWWMFVIPGILVLFIALLSVGGQTLKAAMGNPVESLRDE